MFIKVTTYDKDHNVLSDMHCNVADRNKQEWLFKHILWATRHGHGLQIIDNALSDLPEDIEKQDAYRLLEAKWAAEARSKNADKETTKIVTPRT